RLRDSGAGRGAGPPGGDGPGVAAGVVGAGLPVRLPGGGDGSGGELGRPVRLPAGVGGGRLRLGAGGPAAGGGGRGGRGAPPTRRRPDLEEQAPFAPYHYRIIYQTFHGMRDVLGPLRGEPGTAILPFHYRRLAAAERVLVEACPASSLRLLGLPNRNYKQPEG